MIAELLKFSPLIAPLAALALALLALAQPGRRPQAVLSALAPSSALGLAGSACLIALVALGAESSLTLGGAGLGFSLRLDALSAVMLTMVALLAVVVLRFSATYLDGDERQGQFLGRLGATIAAVELLVLAGNLATFVPAWIATSLALHQLLVFYPERPGAVFAARKKFIVARLGDAALIGAAALLYLGFGTGDLGTIVAGAEAGNGGWQVSVAGVLLAVAAILKSAQFPTHGWLVEVMETPTPVSALLHAGILNAGPFLALRFAAVFQQSVSASALLVLVGGFTALFASVVLLSQPAVKVALGYSSAAHMGFMLLVCGLGVFPAAALHLVAHSFYKAHAFLSSGSVVEVARASAVPVNHKPTRAGGLLAALAGAVVLYLGVAWLLGLRPDENAALLVVGGILLLGLVQLLGATAARASTPAALLRGGSLALFVTLAFFSLEEGTRLLLLGALPPMSEAHGLVLGLSLGVLFAFALAVGLQLMPQGKHPWTRAAYVHLRNGLYANTLFDRWVGALRTPS